MKVKCYDGTFAERREVRRIKGEYYRHSDILMLDGIRYRCTNDRVTRDIRTNILYRSGDIPSDIKRGTIRTTIAKIGRTGNVLYEKQFGGRMQDYPNKLFYYSGNMKSTFTDNNTLIRMKEAGKLRENVESGAYYIVEDPTDESVVKYLEDVASDYQGFMYDRLQYSMVKNTKYFKDHKYTPKANLGLNDLLGELTFGGEFETTSGKIKHDLLLKLGVAPLRDGSISGYEYTTIPLNNIDHLKDIMDVLNSKCTVSYKDSLHFHIGNVPRSKKFLLKMYKVSQKLQNEFYTMVPSYKLKDTHHIKRRDENYTNKLPVIDITKDKAINRLIYFLSDNKEETDNITQRPHPSDPTGEHKWQIHNRYTCINLVNYIYGTNGTIEFRLHQGTTNPYKAIYWLLINIALVKFAINHSVSQISNTSFSIESVIADSFSKHTKVVEALVAYIKDAKAYYSNYPPEDIHFERDNNDDRLFKPKYKLW
jgi:hypothetical protein